MSTESQVGDEVEFKYGDRSMRGTVDLLEGDWVRVVSVPHPGARPWDPQMFYGSIKYVWRREDMDLTE